MMDYASGLKKEVAEVKFLIHDLRVESFFNEVIHYHVTVSTDLEIHSIDQAQVLVAFEQRGILRAHGSERQVGGSESLAARVGAGRLQQAAPAASCRPVQPERRPELARRAQRERRDGLNVGAGMKRFEAQRNAELDAQWQLAHGFRRRRGGPAGRRHGALPRQGAGRPAL